MISIITAVDIIELWREAATKRKETLLCDAYEERDVMPYFKGTCIDKRTKVVLFGRF